MTTCGRNIPSSALHTEGLDGSCSDHTEKPAPDDRIEVDDIIDFFDAETTLYEGNLKPPEYYRQALQPWDEGNPYAEVDYSDGSTILLDSIEKKWIGLVYLPEPSYQC